MNSLSISLSGLNISQTRLDVTANNIANLSTPNFQQKTANLSDQINGGVTVSSITPPRVQNGTEENNVNLEKQMVNLIENKHLYSANLNAIKTQDQMLGTLINIFS